MGSFLCPEKMASGLKAEAASSTATEEIERRPKLPWIRLLLDVIFTVLGIAAVNLGFEVKGATVRGFFCDDQTIMYEEKPSTVTGTALLAYAFSAPLIVILLSEMTLLWCYNDGAVDKIEIGRGKPMRLVLRVMKFYCYALLCQAICSILTGMTKSTIGRLRPNFLDVCQPDFDWRNQCAAHIFVTNYECTSAKSPAQIEDARKSFFSGHSSVALATGTFIVLYLQVQMAGKLYLRSLVPMLQAGVLCGSFWIGLTRISDNKHHWSDVLVGFAVGIIIDILVVGALFLPKYFLQFTFCIGLPMTPAAKRKKRQSEGRNHDDNSSITSVTLAPYSVECVR